MDQESLAAEQPRDEVSDDQRSRTERARPVWITGLFFGCVLIIVVLATGLRVSGSATSDLDAVRTAALETARRSVSTRPGDTGAVLELAYAYRQSGHPRQAIAQCDKVLKVEPNNTAALYNRAMSYRSLKKLESAEADLWDVLELEPDHTQAAIALGDIYSARRQYRSLLVAVRPVVEEHPEVAALQYLTGLAYEKTGRKDWAAVRYRMALDRDPNLSEARRALERLGAER